MSEKVTIKVEHRELHLPTIALRGLVVFPNNLVHFEVGREKSIAAVEWAMANNSNVFLVAQKAMETSDPTQADLFSYGVERMVLDTIKGPEDVKRLSEEERKELAAEIREFLIETTSRTGGHLASNLGVVELTIAMFCALNLPKDKIIWDVGHQSYTHKILSGRKDNFDGLRQYGGLSGF